VTAGAQCTVNGAPAATIPLAAGDWATGSLLTIAAVDDQVLEAPTTCTLSAVASSADDLYDGLTASANASVLDNEAPSVIIDTGNGVAVDEQGPTSDTFMVMLGSQPAGPVTVSFATPDGQTMTTTSLTFTPQDWDAPAGRQPWPRSTTTSTRPARTRPRSTSPSPARRPATRTRQSC